jgi:tetratricopeptide (TPR) repeat protein
MSKKKPYRKRRKGKAKQEEPAMPDPRAMERITADLSRMLSDQEFNSIDEAKAYMEALLTSGAPLPSQSPVSPLAEAQNLVYDAWEASGPLRLSLAREALDISEDCADAWAILAQEAAGSLHEARVLYEAGVRAGERALGQEAFDEYAGHFWGVMETRPYMRARFGLAECLWARGHHQEAIDHFQEMLQLNPGDNQGIRYVLMSYLLEEGQDDDLDRLFDSYDDDQSAVGLYTRALTLFRREGTTDLARKSLQEALGFNRFVPDYLLQRKKMPAQLPEHMGFGDEDEAVVYVATNGHLWHEDEGAIEWLQRIIKLS